MRIKSTIPGMRATFLEFSSLFSSLDLFLSALSPFFSLPRFLSHPSLLPFLHLPRPSLAASSSSPSRSIPFFLFSSASISPPSSPPSSVPPPHTYSRPRDMGAVTKACHYCQERDSRSRSSTWAPDIIVNIQGTFFFRGCLGCILTSCVIFDGSLL